MPFLKFNYGYIFLIRDKKTGGAYSAAGDDDINDVAAMGGVNLAEEAMSIGATDSVGSVIRSCRDESFLLTGNLHQRAARICRERGLASPSQEVKILRTKNFLEVIAKMFPGPQSDLARYPGEAEGSGVETVGDLRTQTGHHQDRGALRGDPGCQTAAQVLRRPG